MSDPRNAIQSMFSEANRYDAFGNLLMRMHVQGFRCHTNTLVEIESPITAFCGLNGTGKSTLLQLAATAYQSPDPELKPYYIKDFLVVGTLDPTPFTSSASVEYKFWQAGRSLRTVTLSRNALTKRWRGYRRRPVRQVLFAGIGLYLPKIEQRDFIVRNARQLEISATSAVTEKVRVWTCKILGCNYDSIASNTVTYSKRTGKVASVERSNIAYSEAHMGYGEGRGHYLISTLEILPEQSLVLIEEPETSLHPSAQYQFGQYLVDVVKRKRHQILLTTHSEYVLRALPSQSVVYLQRTGEGVEPILGLTPLQAKSLMTEGHDKALLVLVEDQCAQAILCEVIRRIDPDCLRSIGIHAVGDANTVSKTVRALKSTGFSIAAVRDADQGDAPSDNIFRLPGTQSPEKELFESEDVREYIQETYGVNLADFAAGNLIDVDHHQWFEKLSQYVSCDEHALTAEVARVFAYSLGEAEASALVNLLKEASRG
jgi:predicted ATPase